MLTLLFIWIPVGRAFFVFVDFRAVFVQIRQLYSTSFRHLLSPQPNCDEFGKVRQEPQSYSNFKKPQIPKLFMVGCQGKDEGKLKLSYSEKLKH